MTRRDVPPCRSGIERDEDNEIKRHKLVVSKKKATTLAGFRMGKRLRNGIRTRRKASWLMQGVFQRGNEANRNDLQEGHPNGELPCSCAGLGHFAPTRARVTVEVVYEVVRHLMDGT
jgi:hypothetical protein